MHLDPDYGGYDPHAAAVDRLAAYLQLSLIVDRALEEMDALDGDFDLELAGDEDDASWPEHWASRSSVRMQHEDAEDGDPAEDDADRERCALERHGCGFIATGHDDAEDGVDDEPNLAGLNCTPDTSTAYGGHSIAPKRSLISPDGGDQTIWAWGGDRDLEDEHDGAEPENEHGGDILDEPHDEDELEADGDELDASFAEDESALVRRLSAFETTPAGHAANRLVMKAMKLAERRLLPTDPLAIAARHEVYAMEVVGSCLHQRLASGSMACFSTRERPQPGDLVIVWFKPGVEPKGFGRVVVKELVGWHDVGLVVATINPASTHFFPSHTIWAAHRFVGVRAQ